MIASIGHSNTTIGHWTLAFAEGSEPILAFLDFLTARITVEEASTAIPQLLDWCAEQELDVESINEFVPPFDDVFVMIMEQVQKEEVAAL